MNLLSFRRALSFPPFPGCPWLHGHNPFAKLSTPPATAVFRLELTWPTALAGHFRWQSLYNSLDLIFTRPFLSPTFSSQPPDRVSGESSHTQHMGLWPWILFLLPQGLRKERALFWCLSFLSPIFVSITPQVMTIEVPAGLRSWFTFFSYSFARPGSHLVLFRYQWACDDAMFSFVGYFLPSFSFLFFSSFLPSSFLHLHSRPPFFSSLNILHLASVSHGLEPFIQFLLPFPVCWVVSANVLPTLLSVCSFLRRLYCVSIVPCVQFGIWCWFDTRGIGVRVVVFIFTFRWTWRTSVVISRPLVYSTTVAIVKTIV